MPPHRFCAETCNDNRKNNNRQRARIVTVWTRYWPERERCRKFALLVSAAYLCCATSASSNRCVCQVNNSVGKPNRGLGSENDTRLPKGEEPCLPDSCLANWVRLFD